MQGMPLNAAESSPTASQPRDAKDLEKKFLILACNKPDRTKVLVH